jgi:hypothetical protein
MGSPNSSQHWAGSGAGVLVAGCPPQAPAAGISRGRPRERTRRTRRQYNADHKQSDPNVRFSSDTTMPGHTQLRSSSFVTSKPSALQQDQEEIEGARAELDRNTVGEQLPPAQQHTETPEFESRVGCCRPRPVCVVLQRIRICLHCSPSAWFVAACNLARVRALVASLNEGLLSGKHRTSPS